jgi:putative nucleotidyltransferase with HDIG domain
MAHGRANEILDEIGNLPVLPPLADELVSAAMSPDGDLRRVLMLVERDPVLAAMVLRMVNSAAFSLSRQVTDLMNAIVLLGASHVRSLALAAAMSALTAAEGWQFEHSFGVACAARIIATSAGADWAETAFAAGILHDIGELVLDTLDGRSADEVPPSARLATERAHYGTDHTLVGAALAERWALPGVLVEGIERHHEPIVGGRLAGASGRSLATVIAAAEDVVDELDGTRHGDGTAAGDALGQLQIADPDRVIGRCRRDRDAHGEALAVQAAGRR